MRIAIRALAVGMLLAAVAACSGPGPGPSGARGAHAKIRVNIKKESSVCTLKVIEKHHRVLLDEEDQLIWRIKDVDRCLNDFDLVVKWNSGAGASKCAEISTKTHGNKTEMKCDIDPRATPNVPHEYKLYFRDKDNKDTEMVDPDVEIVM